MFRDMIRDKLITRKGFNPPYRMAYLYDADGDLSKRWEIHYWIYDEDSSTVVRRKKTIPQKLYPSAKERRAYAAPLIREINQMLVEGFFIPSSKKVSSLISVPDAIVLYLEAKKKTVRTFKDFRTILGTILKPYAEVNWKNRVLADIKPDDIVKYLDFIQVERAISNRTRNQYRGFISSLFQYWIQRGAIEINPVRSVKSEKEEKTKRFIPFSTHQVELLRQTIKNESPQLFLCISFIYYTFLRPKELRLMRIEWIDLPNKKLMVPAEVSKNKKSQYVSIPPALEQIIIESGILKYQRELYAFGKSGVPELTPWGMHHMNLKHKEFIKKLGLSENHTLYSWKHTGACNLYKAYKDIKLVQRQCRHADVQTTDRYLRDLGMYVENDRIDFN